jgi:hypothetical protein
MRLTESVVALCAEDRGFDIRSGQTKNNNIGSDCFSAMNIGIRPMIG